MQLLLESGANIEAPNDRDTAVQRAAAQGHESVRLLLLKSQADVNAAASYGLTALHMAAAQGHESVV